MSSNGGSTVVAGRYRLERRIGRGGAGAVWRAHDERLDRKVAVKQIAIALDAEARSRGRALREARAAARLHVPNVVQVYDVIEEEGSVYLIMELVEAPNLNALVRRKGALEARDAAALGLQMLDALEAAHRAGIVHRDVKPSNVLIHRDTARLTDFGIARISDDPTLTATGAVMGTPAYIAPEHAQGAEIGPAVDLYGLGATLYYAVEGHSPFSAEGSLSTVMAVINSPPRPMTRAGPLTGLLDALLAKDPQQRPAPDEIRRELQKVAGQPERPAGLMHAPWVGGATPQADDDATPQTGDDDVTPQADDDDVTPQADDDDATPQADDDDVTPRTGDDDATPRTDADAGEDPAAGVAAAAAPADAAGTVDPAVAAPTDAAGTVDPAVAAPADATGTTEPTLAAAGSGTADVQGAAPHDGAVATGTAADRSRTADRDAVRDRDAPDRAAARDRDADGPGPRRPGRRIAILASALGLLVVAVIALNSMSEDGRQDASDNPSQRAAAPVASETETAAVDDGGAAGAPTPEPSPTPSPEPSEPSEPPPEDEGDGVLPATDAEVPEDWIEYAPDDAPYRLRHPPDWEVTRRGGNLTDIRDPQSGTYLRLDWVNDRRNPVRAWEQLEETFAADHSDYEGIGISPTTFKGDRAALWEYRYREGGAELHAYNLGVNQGDHGFALNLQSREGAWDEAQELWAQFLSSYEFTGP